MLDAVFSFFVDNTWLSVERLASFVASVCDTTWFLKNAWRPLWRPFVRRLAFVGLLCERNCNHEARDDVLSRGRI